MKQKLKEKFNVDKVKKSSSFTKCVKMSNENLKNGSLNGEKFASAQKQSKLSNSNADRDTKSIVGGRLQFYKGKKTFQRRIFTDYLPVALVMAQSARCLSAGSFKKKIFHSFRYVWCLFCIALCLSLVSFPFYTIILPTSISPLRMLDFLDFFLMMCLPILIPKGNFFDLQRAEDGFLDKC